MRLAALVRDVVRDTALGLVLWGLGMLGLGVAIGIAHLILHPFFH